MSLGQRGRDRAAHRRVQPHTQWLAGVYNGEINWDRTVLRDDLCRSDPTLPTAKRAQSGMVTAGGLTGFLKMALVISREHRELRLEPVRSLGA